MDEKQGLLPVMRPVHCGIHLLLLALAVVAADARPSRAAPELLGASYRADVPFPQYLPFWRESWSLKDAVTGETRDIDTETHGTELCLSLGTLDVTRLILITSDSDLRARLEAFYDERFAANANRLASANP